MRGRTRAAFVIAMARRGISAIPRVLAVVTLVFLFLHLIPGDPVDVMLGETARAADKAALRRALDLDRPIVEQYAHYLRGLATGAETYEVVKSLAERMGKVTMVAEDSPGFVVNRVLLPMINEAVYCLYEGVGAVEDVDKAMKLGTNQPMGPLELADLIGLDTCLAIMEVMQNVLGDDKYRPCPLLKKYVDAGYLGRKSGRGFYQYDDRKK